MGVNSLQWYYTPVSGPTSQVLPLDGDEWHHCYHVLRKRTGDNILLCNGQGSCFEGIIRSTGPKEGQIELIKDWSSHFQNPRNYKTSIGFALTKNIDRTEFVIEKLVEIGVDEISFLECQHGERSHLRIDRMQKIMISAAKQSRKSVFPTLSGVISPVKYVEQKQKEDPRVQVFACHLDVDCKSLSENYLPQKDVVLLIGPEGGFSSEEITSMKQQNVGLIHLGPFRLRVETAAIVACANVHFINQMKKDL